MNNNIIRERIIELAYDLDKEIRKNSETESAFARKNNRKKSNLNMLMTALKSGKGCRIQSIISILEDLGKKIEIVDK